jgi:crotonobetainyl-CoA:carnitine CoA-transferase CaiB-like acyl-CoA transferase
MHPNPPLAGLRVLDFTQRIAGPYCTRLLAAFGAEVVKIERIGRGDPTRGLEEGGALSPMFHYLNAGKSSVTLDLQQAEGREVAQELAAWADLVVESFRPGVLDRHGLGFTVLVASRPGLVMLSLSNFGQTGPYRDFRATELTLQAWAGFVHAGGAPDRPPLKLGFRAAQCAAGQNAFAAALAALLAPPLPGGRHLDIAIFDTALMGLNSAHAHYSYSQVVASRGGRGGRAPRTLQAADGEVLGDAPRAVAAINRLSVAMGRPLPRDDPKALALSIADWAASKGKEEVMQAGQAAHLAWGARNSMADILASSHLHKRAFFEEIHALDAPGLRTPGVPIRLSGWRPNIGAGAAPDLGEHTESVLRGLGRSEVEIGQLRAKGVV